MKKALSELLFPDGVRRAFLRRIVNIPAVTPIWKRFEFGSLELRMEFGISERPYQLYGVYRSAQLARRLGIDSISVIEFGVAGGLGLLEMERIAAEVGKALQMRICVFGFDLGTGLPNPIDFRDMPHIWESGYYQMDEACLRAKLTSAKLLIGDVARTVPEFLRSGNPPIGYISFDLDYYTSTKKALGIFSGDAESRLPRVYCYFDDIMGPDIACHNEYGGELLAIKEFNSREDLKLCQIFGMDHIRVTPAAWHEQIFVLHDFRHPLYTVNVAHEREIRRQLSLTP